MFNSINKSLIIFIPLFSFIVFSSLSFYWVKAPYDAWRIYEILLLIFANILGIQLIFQQKYQIIDIKFDKNISLIISILVFIILISAANSHYPPRAYADASLYFLLMSACLIYANLFKYYKKLAENILACVAILPMLTLMFLPIAIFDRLQGGIGSWTQSFTNIRMLDDALLPCIFLLWLRVGFLKVSDQLTKPKHWLLTISIYSVSTIYLLNFLFHGARACLLAIITGLILSVIYHKKSKQFDLKLPILSGLTALSLYTIYHQILPSSIGSALARTSSSGRIDLWLKAFNTWLENPILGVGGNHFLLQQPYTIIAHPHNIWLKFLSEWGLSVFLLTGLIIALCINIKQKISQIPPLLLAGTIAILINSMLSGSLLYPVSQITSLCVLSYTLSFCLRPNPAPSNINSMKYLWMFLIVLFSSILLLVHGQDIICKDCISIDWEGAPAFWDSGRPLRLEPYVPENLGKPTNKY
ncbi:O-antigen ligase [Acinetobacter sp. YH12040]|uniref:O-antigen ligase family protein n=1 Tax=Acinetobacter sp. YH12040 TaxID=2601048 RepID=UPI0015D31169|nr:O-antigen ligase family protein [Acinetobacter sp. YH12040]